MVRDINVGRLQKQIQTLKSKSEQKRFEQLRFTVTAILNTIAVDTRRTSLILQLVEARLEKGDIDAVATLWNKPQMQAYENLANALRLNNLPYLETTLEAHLRLEREAAERKDTP